jgi:hypothetical protein
VKLIKFCNSKYWLVGILFLTVSSDLVHAGKRKLDLHLDCLVGAKQRIPSGPKVPTNFKIFNEIEAQGVFETVQSMVEVPFGYYRDGCYARSHEVSERLNLDGIESMKVWVLSGQASIFSKKHPKARWSHHVASIIPVREDDGKISWKVIDPTLLSTIGSVAEWLEEMVLNLDYEVVYSSRSEYLRSDLDFGASADEKEGDLNLARQVNEEHLKLLLSGEDIAESPSGSFFF